MKHYKESRRKGIAKKPVCNRKLDVNLRKKLVN